MAEDQEVHEQVSMPLSNPFHLNRIPTSCRLELLEVVGCKQHVDSTMLNKLKISEVSKLSNHERPS